MNRNIVTSVVVAVAMMATTVAAQQPDRGISWVNPEIADVQGLDHRILASKSLGRDVGYVVWTPPGYDSGGETRYPVVYFLHGAGGTEASDSGGFSSRVAAGIRRGSFPAVICVFPNGGRSGYRNEVESMIVDELVPLIDREYLTKAEASGRVVAGFSMGGAGSVWLSLRHPELFCAAGSWGGALSRRGSGADSLLLPTAKSNAEILKKNKYALLTVNGDQDHPEGFTPLKETLEPLGIPHQVVTLRETRHNLGQYYERAGDTMLTFLSARLTGRQDAPTTVRVLTIGNSFAQNACRFLKEIGRSCAVDIVVGTANLGGCTLERHATLAKQSAADPAIRPYSRRTDDGTSKLSLQEYLAVEKWDAVTLQQMSALSYQADTYHPHIDELVTLIRRHAPRAQILIHETWAYRPDAPYLKEHSLTQAEMYRQLVKAYADVAANIEAPIIPVGTAFQQVRSTPGREVIVPDPNFDFDNPVFPNRPDQQHSLVTGWYWNTRGDSQTLQLDFKHANVAGCYLAGLVCYETLTGNDARDVTYVPEGVGQTDAEFYRSTAHEVVERQTHAAAPRR